MAEITIQTGIFEDYVGLDPALELRIYNSESYATPGGENVVGGRFRLNSGSPSTDRQYQSVPCTFDADTGDVTFPEFITDSTEDGFPNTATKTFALFSSSGCLIETVYENLRIPASPSPTTLAAIKAYNVSQEPFNSCMQYLTATYGGDLGAAITAIGSTVTDLIVTCPYTETIDRTVPVNITIRPMGRGTFTVPTGKTLTILSIADGSMATKKYFFGAGNVILGMNASSRIMGEWWCGRSAPGVDNTHGIVQAVLSAINQGTKLIGGSIIEFGAGHWEFSEVVLPKMVKVRGAGMDPDAGSYSPFTFAGTVFKLYDETKSFLFKVPGGSRFLSLEECSLTTGNAVAARCIYHNVTEFSDGLFFNNVSVQSTRAPASRDADDSPRSAWLATPLFEVHATAGQESIRQIFDGVWFQVPENGKGFYCDTPNTTVTFNNCKGQAGKQATILHMHNCGPVTENDNCDWEGSGTYDDLRHVWQRDIVSASVARIAGQANPGLNQPFSRITLDPATPSDHRFEPNDMGRSFIFAGGNSAPGGFDAYVTKIEDPFNAVLSFYPTSPIVSQPCEVHTFTDHPNLAYAVRIASGNVVSWTANSAIDEGLNYSLVAGTGNFANFQFNNCFLQGRIKVIESCKIDINGGHLPGLAFEDHTTTQAIEVNINDVVFSNTYFGQNLFAITPDVWRIRRIVGGVDYSYTPTVKGVFPTYDMFADTYDFVSARRISQTTNFSNDYGAASTDAPLRAVSYARHQGAAQRDLVQFGQWDQLTNRWVGEANNLPLNYGIGRSDVVGRAFMRGGQVVADDPRLIGFDLAGDYTGRNFRGGGYLYPSQSANFTLDISQHIERYTLLSSSVDEISIAGCFAGVTRDATTGLPTSVQYPYEEHFLVNTNASRVFYLKNEDTSTTATLRWRTNSGKTITFRPNEILRIVYDPAIARFRVAPLGIGLSPVLPGALFLPDEFELGTTGAQDLDCSKAASTFTMAITGNVTLTPINLGGGSGQVIFLNILTTNTSAYTITFASPFKTVGGVLITSAFAAISQNMIFKERGGFLEEFSRSGVMS